MSPRLNPMEAGPEAMAQMMAVETYLRGCGLEPALMHLVKLRASQMNGCAYCLAMHTADARAGGEREERLYLLEAWREAGFYSPRERAALGWTEALTRIAKTHAPDADYQALTPLFAQKEIVDLTLLIGTINSWNRLTISFRSEHPKLRAKAA